MFCTPKKPENFCFGAYLESVKNELETMQNSGYRISITLKQRLLEIAEEIP